jgi:hypothetical protein
MAGQSNPIVNCKPGSNSGIGVGVGVLVLVGAAVSVGDTVAVAVGYSVGSGDAAGLQDPSARIAMSTPQVAAEKER